jgi:hypothetical protein
MAPEQLSFAGGAAPFVIQILNPFPELEVLPVGLNVVETRT